MRQTFALWFFLIDDNENWYTWDSGGRLVEGSIAYQNPYRYAGYRYDNETGLYYVMARYYNADTGRFLSEDPYPGDQDDPLSQNPYIYTKNNPVMFIDSTGEDNELISFGADFIPGVGNAKSAVEAVTGKDYITGEKLSGVERGLAAAGLLFGGWVKKLKYLGKLDDLAGFAKVSKGGKAGGNIKNVYNTIKQASKYPDGFKAVQNGTKKVNINNNDVLNELKQVESGKWKKVYKDGFDANGNKVSIHYFESSSGKVFDVKVKSGWSNK